MTSTAPNIKERRSMKLSGFLFSLVVTLSFFGFVGFAQAATQWVNNPASCNIVDEANFPGQNCIPENICGDNAGIAQCYNTASLLPPAISATSNTLYSASYPNGGYILNCYAAQDSAEPFCDNNGSYWCNRSNTCYTTQQRDTTCTANTWATATCGACRTGYGDCNGDLGVCEVQYNVTNYIAGTNNHYGVSCLLADVRCDSGYYDCDASGVGAGNGCEELRSGACTTGGGLDGTWSCSVDAGGSCTDGGSNYTCTCVPPKQYFETGTEAQYATVDPLLWGVQYGAGDLIHFGNGSNSDLFVVQNDGSVNLAQITAPAITTDLLYNVGGTLYWNGSAVGSGGGAGGSAIWDTDLDTGIQTEESADEDIIRMDVAGSEAVVIQNAVGAPVLSVTSPLGGYANFMTNNNDEYDRFEMSTKDVLSQFEGDLNFNFNPEEGWAMYYGSGIAELGFTYQTFAVRVNNHADALRIDQNANVGLGVGNPHAKLDIGEGMIATPAGDISILLTQDGGDTFLEMASTDMAEGVLMRGGAADPAYDYGVLRQLSSTGYASGWETGLHIFTGDNGTAPDPIMFSIDGAEIMRLTDDGNVGIGTDSPEEMLSVKGDVLVGQNEATILPAGGIDRNLYLRARDGSLPGNQGVTNIIFQRDATDLTRISTSQANTLLLQPYSGGAWQAGLSVASTGNVGIRTNAPSFPLHVASPDSNISAYFETLGSSRTGVYIGNGSMFSADESGLYDIAGDVPFAVLDGTTNIMHYTSWVSVDADNGNMAVGTSSVEPSAALMLESNDSGFLMPRLTTVQRDAIASPATSLQIYNLTSGQFEYFDGVDWVALGGSGGGGMVVTDINFTVATTDGDFSAGGFVGYEAANYMCDAEYPGSYFCRTDEVIQFIRTNGSVGFTGLTAWIAEGPPGYTSNSNDCNGWTDNLDTKLGAFWQFTNPGGGMGWLTNCAVIKSLACCE